MMVSKGIAVCRLATAMEVSSVLYAMQIMKLAASNITLNVSWRAYPDKPGK